MDVYEPTRFVLEQLFERGVSGGLIVIDDFNTVAGATLAVNELLEKHPTLTLQKTGLYNTPSYIKK